ncbi:MAG: 2-oxo acid dehydrogenase subunit E2, partial [Sedimentisphaerales bacterium]|nr:2-oxo acid dehydrogenase subunit E2 [Sedimentisphaerales bacterium]
MAREIRLPQLGETMDTGTIVGCPVKVGDQVKKGDIIFEIETDKATLEMESPADGFVKHILAEVNETLPVGAPIMILGDKDEIVPQGFIDSLKGGIAKTAPASPIAEPTKVEPEPSRPDGKIMASPRAKKLAEELGVDLATVAGTGPAGKITEEDVKAAAATKTRDEGRETMDEGVEVKLGQTIPLNRIQRITAKKMLKSKLEIPCFYLTVKADVTDLVAMRKKMNESGDVHPVRNSIGNNMTQKGKISNGVKISYNDFIIKAVATGLEKFPIMTGQLTGDTIK